MRPSRRSPLVRLAVATLGLLGAAAAVRAEPDESSLARRAERAAAALARAQVAEPDRFEVLAARFGGADRTERPVRLEPLEVVGPNAAGMVRVTFRMIDRADSVSRGIARASVRGRVFGPAVQATRTLTRERIIAASDLALRESDLTRFVDEPLREPSRAVGLVPLRSLGSGRVLAAELLGAAPVVRRGETVDLRYERDSFHVVVSAVALRDGAPGDVVPAENDATGVVIRGLVRADGTLLATR